MFQCWKSEPASSSLHCHDNPKVYTIHKRTLIKKRELFDAVNSFHIKADYKKDKISPEYQFVYCSSNVRIYMWWTPVALFLIGTILVLCFKIIFDDVYSGKPSANVEYGMLGLDDFNPLDVAYILFPLALSALVVFLYCFRSVLLRLYYNKSTNEFIAVMLRYGIYKKKIHFRPSDVINLEKNQMLGNVLVKGIPMRVTENSFIDTAVYNIFMGYKVSRPREVQPDSEDFRKSLEQIKSRMEKKRTDDFLENYKEKRKQRQQKSTDG